MALNFQQVFDKIRQIGLGARAQQESMQRLQERARQLLEAWTDKGAELQEKVERARQADPNLRCALPLDERLDSSNGEPSSVEHFTLLAVERRAHGREHDVNSLLAWDTVPGIMPRVERITRLEF